MNAKYGILKIESINVYSTTRYDNDLSVRSNEQMNKNAIASIAFDHLKVCYFLCAHTTFRFHRSLCPLCSLIGQCACICR